MIKALPLLCCWMFAIFSRGKGTYRLVNGRHRCNKGSSLIEWSTGTQEGQARCTDSSQGEPRSTANEENPPLHCSPVIAVSLICPLASCLWKSMRSAKQSSGMSLATPAWHSPACKMRNKWKLKYQAGILMEKNEKRRMDWTVRRRQCYRCLGSKDGCQASDIGTQRCIVLQQTIGLCHNKIGCWKAAWY